MSSAPVVVWFRDDLRIADNPALCAAADQRAPVIALYVLDEESSGIRSLGGAAKWWLHHSLSALQADLADHGIPLVLRHGAAPAEVVDIVGQVGAGAVVWNRRYGGPERSVDTEVKASLSAAGIEVESFAASLLFEPWMIRTRNGDPYSVFAPFWKACNAAPPPRLPLSVPERINRSADLTGVTRLEMDELALLPKHPDWASGLRAAWRPGEASAQRALADFFDGSLRTYASDREIPGTPGTSRLSPHLRWGEISPFQAWHAAKVMRQEASEGVRAFLSELGWHEFAWHTLYHSPDLATANWRPGFDAFPWPAIRPDLLTAWQEGRTGFRLVDAGMRELWRTGWMHNRVRMVTASFLTKNLLVDWREGERWFWDTLVDADSASNPFNWQWVAGSGPDSSPYFRVFNPELQAAKFDPADRYTRANIEEWRTGEYPDPIVDLRETRANALDAYETVRNRP